MNAFSVRVRPLDGTCQVRVDGIENTKWLIRRLGQFFVFKTAEPVKEDEVTNEIRGLRVHEDMSHALSERLPRVDGELLKQPMLPIGEPAVIGGKTPKHSEQASEQGMGPILTDPAREIGRAGAQQRAGTPWARRAG